MIPGPIYSLGVVLYELLAGDTPYGRERFLQARFEQVRRILQDEIAVKPSLRVRKSDEQSLTTAEARRSDPLMLERMLPG